MTPAEMTSQLVALGFTPGDQKADLGMYREWLIYLTRKYQGQYQHLWLTTYDDRFVEAILYVYPKAFNPRARPAQQTIHCAIYRNMEEIFAAVAKVYGAAVVKAP